MKHSWRTPVQIINLLLGKVDDESIPPFTCLQPEKDLKQRLRSRKPSTGPRRGDFSFGKGSNTEEDAILGKSRVVHSQLQKRQRIAKMSREYQVSLQKFLVKTKDIEDSAIDLKKLKKVMTIRMTELPTVEDVRKRHSQILKKLLTLF